MSIRSELDTSIRHALGRVRHFPNWAPRTVLFLLALPCLCLPAQGPPLTPRYVGQRWQIGYSSYDGPQRFAVNEVQRVLQQFVPYVIEVHSAAQVEETQGNLILIGIARENPLLGELETKGLIRRPGSSQSYTMTCIESPWQRGMKIVAISGYDPAGVMYGAVDFAKKLSSLMPDDPASWQHALDALEHFDISESPVIENRGLWSWGYVIYDYRGYFDNMARLKMNRIIIWNDVPPINSKELIQYAHDRGIKVIFGFSWGWGTAANLSNENDLAKANQQVLREYREHYRQLGLDGIYFQTLTENNHTSEDGHSTAYLATKWVNAIAQPLLQEDPSLHIEFGLHATSIQEHYPDLRALDPRVVITWEDAGVMPYSYDPIISVPQSEAMDGPPDAGRTLEYSKKLATFRDSQSEFSMVAKGWTTLRWKDEFEHHRSFILGERSRSFIQSREHQRRARWASVNAQWLNNYPVALRFFGELRKSCKGTMTVEGLIEDGLFEERLQPSAVLLGEMLWNPYRSPDEYIRSAFNTYLSEVNGTQ